MIPSQQPRKIKWKEHKSNSQHYYYVAYGDQQRSLKITGTEDKDLEEMQKVLLEVPDPNIYRVTDTKVAHSTIITSPETDIVDLPPGRYQYYEGQYGLPDRLEKIELTTQCYFETNQSLLEYVNDDLNRFLKSENIYKEMLIPYRRGYLFYGPPGNGKTGFIRHAVSKIVPEDAYVIWMNEIPDMEIVKALKEAPGLKVFIIEEVTTKRNNYDYTQALLSFLDGEHSVTNSIVIATTNYPETLEQNLADRPTRFDICVEISEPNELESKTFFEKFLNREINPNEVTLKGMTIAHIKEICLMHRMSGKTLQECYDNAMINRKKFKNNFVKKGKIGL